MNVTHEIWMITSYLTFQLHMKYPTHRELKLSKMDAKKKTTLK